MKPITERIQKDVMLPAEKAKDVSLPAAAVFLLITFVIMLFGITMLYSTSFGTAGTGFFTKQIQWAVVGLIGMFAVILFGYRRVSDWSPWLMIGVALLLIIADLSPAIKGGHRWIKIPHVGNIQPSEYAKVIISLFLAKFIAEHARFLETHPYKKVFFPAAFCCFGVILLVLVGHDLGTTILLSLIFLSTMFIAGVPFVRPTIATIIIGIAGFFWIKNYDPMRWARLTIFLDPEPYADGKGYQLWNSLLALGSGKWFGLGFTESRLKMAYLPEAHTDFILSIVGEELGLVFLLLVICAYIFYSAFAFRIAMNARTRQGTFLAFAIGFFIGLQAIINIGVICGGFPTKGMPAPFISYGGSNLVTCLTASGLVLSVALDSAFPDYHKHWPEFFRKKWNQFKEKLH